MSTTEKHLARLDSIRKAKERQHIRPLASPSVVDAHLSGEVDQSFIDNFGAAKEFREKISHFDESAIHKNALESLERISIGGAVDNILEPIFLSLFDGALRAFNLGTQQGLTASRLYQECKVFTYADAGNSRPMIDNYTENLNERQNIAEFGSQSSYREGKLTRNGKEENMRDKAKMKATKKAHFGDGYHAKDEYDDDDIFLTKAGANSNGRKDRFAETDHVLSCAEKCNQLKSNKALHPEDIRKIVNIDENLAITSKQNNAGAKVGKHDKSRDQLQKEIDQGYTEDKNGKKAKVLTDKEKQTRQNIVNRMDKAQQAIDTATNKTVLKNIATDTKVQATLGQDAAISSGHFAMGDVILFAFKPLFYELSDCFFNGIEEGVSASSFTEALTIRMTRMKDHVWNKALPLLKDTALSLFKNFLSMLIEGILNCFVGIFKQITSAVKQGFKILMDAVPILTDKNTTPAQKGDALLKLAAGSLSVFAALAIESWLSSMGLPEWASIILTSVMTAVLTALVMYLLDKMDLFGVNQKLKLSRIHEILDLEIEAAQDEIFKGLEQLT